MRPRTLISVLIGIMAIAVLLWLGIYAYDHIIIGAANPAPSPFEEQPPAMTAFLVAWPNFVVDGSNLNKVEVWAVPSGTSVAPRDYYFIGNAVLQTGSDPLTQIWTSAIPREPVLATEIFAKGFDAKGELVGQMSLPYLGATQIFNAVWASAPLTTSSVSSVQRHFSFSLEVGEEADAGGLAVKLLEIESDSRCPRNAVCIWAGEVAARVRLINGTPDETVSLHSMSGPAIFGKYQISISGVSPARSSNPPAQSDYKVTFLVERL